MTDSFAPTRWTLVMRAKGADPAARAALSELCAAYYAPVVAFLRWRLQNEDAARDQAHAFFARILEGRALAGANPQGGRFRSYLLGAVRHFMADELDRARAAKRGGGAQLESLEECEERVAESPGKEEAAFDREWALTIIQRALGHVEKEWVEGGKANQFELLKPCLLGTEPVLPAADLAPKLGMSEGAVKVAVHRLRARFRDEVKAEIAQTVPESSDIDDELRHLITVLAAR